MNIGGAYRLMACFNFPRLMVVDSLVSHAVQVKLQMILSFFGWITPRTCLYRPHA